MARWNSLRGPAAPFAFTGAFAAITGLTVTREWDGSPVLIAHNAELNAGAGGAVGTLVAPFVDGIAQGIGFRRDLAAGEIFRGAAVHFINLAPGSHTIDLRVNGPAGAGNQIPTNGAIFDVIELPRWDTEDNLTV